MKSAVAFPWARRAPLLAVLTVSSGCGDSSEREPKAKDESSEMGEPAPAEMDEGASPPANPAGAKPAEADARVMDSPRGSSVDASVSSVPLAAGLGTPCATRSDCLADSECVNPNQASLKATCEAGTLCVGITLYRAALGWNRGYCAPRCTSGTSCGRTSSYTGACLFGYVNSTLTLGGESSHCGLYCGPNNECPTGLSCSAGLTCGDPTASNFKICLPCGPTTGAGKLSAAPGT